jgi:hypothetical protein
VLCIIASMLPGCLHAWFSWSSGNLAYVHATLSKVTSTQHNSQVLQCNDLQRQLQTL